MIGSNWSCPYCNRAQVVTQSRFDRSGSFIKVDGSLFARPVYITYAIVCANPNCKEMVFSLSLGESDTNASSLKLNSVKHAWHLLPPSQARPQPDYIPEVLRNDYYEACSIRDLSPKAAATLARRCLQGMIRDFFGISKPTLYAEINELRRQAEANETREPIALDVLDVIDHVRQIGNIGAHMERDINVIIDVDPEEAQVLISLIETLFDDWYASRHTRQQRFAKLREIADRKKT